jgi:hypothetical protein
MRRRFISEDELNRVLKLKQVGASWLRIQNETGIPRRLAKKAYDEWERTRSGEELKKARTVIAQEEFRKHMEDLIEVAQHLVDSLHAPAPIEKIPKLDRFFDRIWEQDIRHEGKQPPSDRELAHVVRHNKMLFQCLQDHTDEKVPWQQLREWQHIFTQYTRHCSDLQAESRGVIDDLLRQKKEIRSAIQEMDRGQEIIEKMASGVVEALWRGMMNGEIIKERIFIGAREANDRSAMVSFGKEGSVRAFMLKNKKLADAVVNVCKLAVNSLLSGSKLSFVQKVAADIAAMEQKAKELDEKLDDLVLRPLILRTRCELCPA